MYGVRVGDAYGGVTHVQEENLVAMTAERYKTIEQGRTRFERGEYRSSSH